MTTPGAPDRMVKVLAGIALLVVLAIIVLAIFPSTPPVPRPASAPAASIPDLERSLAAARKACVDGPPQGPSCAEAARLTTELAKASARP